MAKGQQRSNKEAKKPKKEQIPAKPATPQPAITTLIVERGKKKK